MADVEMPQVASAVIIPEATEAAEAGAEAIPPETQAQPTQPPDEAIPAAVQADTTAPSPPQSQEPPTSGATKRRPSEDSESQNPSKRSRRDSTSTPNGTKSSRTAAPTADRARNKRLFSSLLSTLSASSRPSPTAASTLARRASIEARQSAKLRQQESDAALRQKEKLDSLIASRRREQVRFDSWGLKRKWEQQRLCAGFLRTRTRPELYYKPWELRVEEREVIERQEREIEEGIERETEEWERRRDEEEEREEERRVREERRLREERQERRERNGGDVEGGDVTMRESPDYGPRGDAASRDEDEAKEAQESTEVQHTLTTNGDRDHDHDGNRDAGEDNEEMMVEGEDAVIY